MQEFEVGDKVLVEAEIVDKSEVNLNKYQIDIDCYEYSSYAWVNGKNIHLGDITAKTYEDGMMQAWSIARKIAVDEEDGGFGIKKTVQIFGSRCVADVFDNFTAAEAAAKIKAWEDAREIQENDVVRGKDNGLYGLVTMVYKNDTCHVKWQDGSCGSSNVRDLTKTGRTIDIAGLLAEIGGRNETD